MTSALNYFDWRASEVEQQAAEWVTRIDLRGTPEEWAVLDTWLNTSPRHRAAFLRLSVAWRRADALKALAPMSGELDVDLLDPARYDAARSEPEAEIEDAIASVASDAEHSPTHTTPVRPLRVVASTAVPSASVGHWVAVHRYRESSVDTPHAIENRSTSSVLRYVTLLGGYAVVASSAIGAFQLVGLIFQALAAAFTVNSWVSSPGGALIQGTVMTAGCLLGAAIGRLSLRAQEDQ